MVCPPVRSIIHSLKLVGYLSVQADKHALSSTELWVNLFPEATVKIKQKIRSFENVL